MSRALSLLLLCLAALLPLAPLSHAQAAPAPALTVIDHPAAGAFPLVYDHTAAGMHVDAGDFKVAQIAADCLAADIQAVTDVLPRISPTLTGLAKNLVLIGTSAAARPSISSSARAAWM
jgi:hypothetical protein